jgi:DNA-binding NarL/FixJ family response regulator
VAFFRIAGKVSVSSRVPLIQFTSTGNGTMKHGCLLLADSHMIMLGGVRGLLEPFFETIMMVTDEKSLLEASEKVRPDLIVVDLSMPVSREINVARRLGKTFPDRKFIILSIHDEPAAVEECLEAGAAGFVLKRAADTDLILAVEAVMKGDIYVSSTRYLHRVA